MKKKRQNVVDIDGNKIIIKEHKHCILKKNCNCKNKDKCPG